MRDRMWGNEYRLTVICVDSYEKSVPVGRLYHPSLERGESFQSLTQLILIMESIFNKMDFPQACMSPRTFFADIEMEERPPPLSEPKEGALATFETRVIFRQHASWQGTVLWQEKGKEQSFRSVLELILLMESALSEKRQIPL